MNNTRRGFLASLLALLSMSRSASADPSVVTNKLGGKYAFGGVLNTKGKIVFINNTGMTAQMIIAPSIVAETVFYNVNAGAQIESLGDWRLTTALGTRDPFPPNSPLPAKAVFYPNPNTTATYYLNYTNGTFEISQTKVDPPVMT